MIYAKCTTGVTRILFFNSKNKTLLGSHIEKYFYKYSKEIEYLKQFLLNAENNTIDKKKLEEFLNELNQKNLISKKNYKIIIQTLKKITDKKEKLKENKSKTALDEPLINFLNNEYKYLKNKIELLNMKLIKSIETLIKTLKNPETPRPHPAKTMAEQGS